MHSRRARIKVQPKVKDSFSRSSTVIKKYVTVSESSEKHSEFDGTAARIVNDSTAIDEKIILRTAWQNANLKERCDLQENIVSQSFPAPKLKIGLDGKVKIDENSLVIPRIFSPVREKAVKNKCPRAEVRGKLCESPIKANISNSSVKDKTCKLTVKDKGPKSNTRNKTCKSMVKNKSSRSKSQHVSTSRSILKKKFGRGVSSENWHKNEKCIATVSSGTEDTSRNNYQCSQIICKEGLQVDINMPVPLRSTASTNEKIKDRNEHQGVNCPTKGSHNRKKKMKEMTEPVNPELPDSVNPELPDSVNPELPDSVNPELPDPINPELPDDLVILHQDNLTTNDDLVNQTSESCFPAARLKIGPDGKVIVDEESLVIKRTSSGTMKQTENMSTKSTAKRSHHWDKYDTASFYRALSCFGTNFTFIADILQKWSKKDIKRKYQKEYQKNPRLVDWVCKHASVMKIKTLDGGKDESSNELMLKENDDTDVEKEICGDSRNKVFNYHVNCMPDSTNHVEADVTQNGAIIPENEDLVNAVIIHYPDVLNKSCVDISTTQRQHLLPNQSVTNCQFIDKDMYTIQQQTCDNQFGSAENNSNKEYIVDAEKGMRLATDLNNVEQTNTCDVDNRTSLKSDEELVKRNFDLETGSTKLTIISERVTQQKATKRKWQPNISKMHSKTKLSKAPPLPRNSVLLS